LQGFSIGAVYDLVREVNQKVGSFASDILADAAKRREKVVARLRGAHRAAAR
jgi:hypothetical protein